MITLALRTLNEAVTGIRRRSCVLRCACVTPKSKPHSILPTDSLSGHVLTSVCSRRGVCADTETCPSQSSAERTRPSPTLSRNSCGGARRHLGAPVRAQCSCNVLRRGRRRRRSSDRICVTSSRHLRLHAELYSGRSSFTGRTSIAKSLIATRGEAATG